MAKHIFDSKKMKKLESPERQKMLPAVEILESLSLKADDTFADIGCGIGYFSIPAAQMMAENGQVLAFDIQTEMIEELNRRIDAAELSNIKAFIMESNLIPIDDESVSVVFICTVVHEVDQKGKFIQEAKRILKKDGRIVIVDWIKDDMQAGPPKDHRISNQEVEELLLNSGLKEARTKKWNEFFYITSAIN